MYHVIPQPPIEIGGRVFEDSTHISVNGAMVPRELLEALADTQRSSSGARSDETEVEGGVSRTEPALTDSQIRAVWDGYTRHSDPFDDSGVNFFAAHRASNKGSKIMEVKLAEALLRRKELQGKVDKLKAITDKDMFEMKHGRKAVNEGWDDIVLQVPLLTASQVTAEYDWHARQLRLVDAAIQQANWTCAVTVEDSVMADYTQPPKPEARGKA